MASGRMPVKAKRNATAQANRLLLLERAQEAIDYLMACDGAVDCTKQEFAEEMFFRTRRSHWMKDDKPNRRLVEDVCNLTRDQHDFPEVAAVLGGYMITYAPTRGGMILIGSDGEMRLDHLLHMLAGDALRQQSTKTINRRRIASWKTAARMALTDGDHELGLLLGQMENEIDGTGFISDSLVDDFLKAMTSRGVEVVA